jgi:hypothetical protein
MAVGTGMGINVSGLEKELNKLDKQLNSIIAKGEKARDALEKMLTGSKANDILDKMNKLKQSVIDMSSLKDPMKWDSKSLVGYINHVNRLIRTMEQINKVDGGKKKLIDTAEVKAARTELKSLLSEVRALEKEKSLKSTSRNQTYSGAIKYSDNAKTMEQERQAIVNLQAAREKLKQTDADYATKLNTINEAIQKHTLSIQQASMTDKQRADEVRKLANEQAKLDSANRKKNYQSYVTTYDGALRTSDRAKNIQQEEAAIKNLEAARAKLSKTDSDYTNKLNTLNAAIEKHKESIRQATAASVKSSTDLLSMKGSAKSLSELKTYSKEIERTMNSLNPKSAEWNKLNSILGQTNHKISGIQRSMNTLNNESSKLSNAFGRIGRSIATAFSIREIFRFAKQIVDVHSQFEIMNRALISIVGNLEDGNRIWQQTIELAKNSPFEVKELLQYTRQLAAYRIETTKLHKTTKMLADVSAGLGVDMSRLILAYGQVRAAEYLRGTELRQFTEAGVPMLEELAKHLSKVEERSISVAEVFNMISKRKISFEDVNAVFENMTGSDGAFYQMQEKMASTIKGNISRLKDEWNLMMYEIGTSNSGIIKRIIGWLRDLIKNWETVAETAKIFFSLWLGYQVTSIIAAMGGIKAATTVAARAYLSLAAAASRAKAVMLSVGGWVGILVAGLSYFLMYSEKIDKSQEAQQRRAEELEDELKTIKRHYEDINNTVRSLVDKIRDIGQNTQDAQVALLKIAEIASEEYNMVINVDVDGLTDEEILNYSLELQRKIQRVANYASSLETAWESNTDMPTYITNLGDYFSDPTIIENDIDDFIDALYSYISSNFDKFVTKIRNIPEDERSNIMNLLADKYGLSKESWTKFVLDFEGLPEIDFINAYQDYFGELQVPTNANERLFFNDPNASGINKDLKSRLMLVNDAIYSAKDLTVIVDTFLKQRAHDFANRIALIEDNEEKVNAANTALSNLIKRGELLGSTAMSFKQHLEDELGFKLQIAPDAMPDWQVSFNEYIDGLVNPIEGLSSEYIEGNLKESESAGKFIKKLASGNNKTIEALKKEMKELADAEKEIIEAYEGGEQGVYSEEDYLVAKEKFKDFYAAWEWLGGLETDKKNTDKTIEERIRIIKEMHKAYLDLAGTLSDAESIDAAFAKYKDAYESAYSGTSLMPDNFGEMSASDFIENFAFHTEEGVTEFFERLKNIVADKEDKIKVDLAKAEFIGEIRLKTRKDEYENIQNKIEKQFSDYELSLELKKLHIPPGLAKSLFDVDMINIEELKKNIIAIYSDVEHLTDDQKKNLSELLSKPIIQAEDWNIISELTSKDQANAIKRTLENIAKMELDYEREKMRTYSKYLVEGMNDRIKLKIEEMRKLKEIEESKEFTPEQKEQIKKQVSAEARAEQDKQEWESFKGTEMYTMMFDDLELLGTQALATLQDKLEKLKSSLSHLPANELKEIVQQISKIEDATIANGNPFKYMRESIKGNEGAIAKFEKETGTDFKKESEFQTDLINAQAAEAEAQRIIDAINLVKNAQLEHGEQQGLLLVQQTDKAAYDEYMRQVEAAKLQNQTLEQVLETQEGIVASSKQASANAARGINIHQRSKKAIQEQAKTWSEYESNASEAMSVIKDMMSLFGASEMAMSIADSTESMIALTFQAIQFGLQMQIAGYQANMALGVIGWILIAIQAIATILSAIFNAKDAKLQAQVEEHLDRVKELEAEYEGFEELIDKAWDTASIQEYNAELRRTTDEMKIAQQAAITARKDEKDYKNGEADAVNEVEEMQKELDEMDKRLEESLAESFSKLTDGILDDVLDAAKDFTDAWYDAFKETGDGLSGLEENFEEMFMDLAKNQAAMQITSMWTEQWKNALGDYVNEKDTELTADEAADWARRVKESFPELNAALEAFLGTISNGFGGESGSLSELQKGIQGVTEETAQVLEALLNSMRLYVADTNNEIKSQTTYIKRMWQMMDNAVTGNSPFYVQMKTI